MHICHVHLENNKQFNNYKIIIFHRLFQVISSRAVPSEGKCVSKLWFAKWCFKSEGDKTWPHVAHITYGSVATMPPLTLISDRWTRKSCCCFEMSGRRQINSGNKAEKQSSPITSRQFYKLTQNKNIPQKVNRNNSKKNSKLFYRIVFFSVQTSASKLSWYGAKFFYLLPLIT